jgi:hypothetical protein
MLRQTGLVCVGSLLVVVIGCAFRLGNSTVQVDVKVNDEVVKDTVDSVAQRIENEMRRLGLLVAVSRDGDVVSLTSTTKAGQRFTVMLSRVRGAQGEQTSIHVDWEQASDRNLWLQLLVVAGQATVSTH